MEGLRPCDEYECCRVGSNQAGRPTLKPLFFWDLEQQAAGLDRVYGGELYRQGDRLVMVLYFDPLNFKYLILTEAI